MRKKILHTCLRITISLLLTLAVTQFTYALTGPGSSWVYVRKIALAPATTVANYQVKISLSGAAQFAHMNASGNDLRFYDINDNPCNYYIESWVFNTAATIWVKVPVSGTNALYLFYGNGSALAASNASGTYDFYDNGSSLAGWTNVGGTVDAVNGQPAPSFKAIENQYGARDIGLTPNKILEFSSNVINSSVDLCNFYFLANASGAGQMIRLETRASNSSGFATTSSWILWAAPSGFGPVTAGTWHAVRIVIKATTADAFIDNVAFGTNFTFTNSGGYVAFHGDGPSVTGGYFDNIRVRQYMATEPVSTVNAEVTNNLAASISTQTNVLCNGQSTGSATGAAAGGSPGYTYSWNSSPVQNTQTASGLPAGPFTVTVTDNIGLTATAIATITQPIVPATSFTKTDVNCFNAGNGTIVITGINGISPYTYSIDNGIGGYVAGNSFNPLSPGVYKIRVKDANGCESRLVP